MVSPIERESGCEGALRLECMSPLIDGTEDGADVVGQNWVGGGVLSSQKEAGFLEVVDEVLG